MVIIAALGAFRKVSAQSEPETKHIVTMIADAMASPTFKSMSVEDQTKKVSTWMDALSDKIQQQFSEHIKKGELIDAGKDLAFFEQISKGIKEGRAVELVKGLRAELEQEKERQDEEKNKKEQEYEKQVEEFNKISGKISHNRIESGGIQYIGDKMYATFTSSSLDVDQARDKAVMGLNAFIIKNNLKQAEIKANHKTEKDGKLFLNTAFLEINK